MPLTDRLRVLVVDDTADNIHLLLNCLSDQFAVIVATNGETALQMAQQSEAAPDIILLDIMMPGMDGYEVCRRLKNNPATAHIPVIFITAMSDEKDERRGLELGAVDYIYKPINQSLVKARVQNHLELKKYHDYLEDLVQQRTADLAQANRQLQAELEERKRYEERLYRQANFDELTGLPNRNYCQWYFEQRCEHCRASDACRDSIILLDIDNLKFINDTFGHDFGDLLLQEIAERLKRLLGEDGLVSRFVGDKFLVLPKDRPNLTAVQAVADRIHRAMNEVFTVRSTELYAKASLGVASCSPGSGGFLGLLKNAEIAMYQAKKNGKNCVVGYTPELNRAVQQRLRLETGLHRALERNEFSLHYQPQINLRSGCIAGVEALLRWAPEGEASISPAEFIPLLEESGLVVEVGAWVLREACHQCVQWQQQGFGNLRISVNISVSQFMRSDLEQTVRQTLKETGLAPGMLCLELTESMLMQDSEKTMLKLAALHDTGTVISLDDFGTGFSSLEYLGRLPLRELKIDRTFVQRMLNTPNDAAVVNTIIAMAEGLNLELVAEGVETVEQLQYLRAKQCETIQGFLFSRPLTGTAFQELLKTWDPQTAGP